MSLQNIYFTYMLKCWRTPKAFKKGIPKHGHAIYTGYSSNIARRLHQHLTGKRFGSRPTYTSQFKGMLELGYLEAYTTEREARKREDEIKTFSRDKKIKMMQELLDPEIQIIIGLNQSVLKMLKNPHHGS